MGAVAQISGFQFMLLQLPRFNAARRPILPQGMDRLFAFRSFKLQPETFCASWTNVDYKVLLNSGVAIKRVPMPKTRRNNRSN
jgi:hypothetical protein